MNGMILQAPPESKDIKQVSKKGANTASSEDGELFEKLVEKLVSKEKEGENSSFLLGKLLDIAPELKEKGKIISEFSKGDILKMVTGEDEETEVVLEDLFKVALALKNGENFSTIPMSQGLKEVLSDKNIVQEFKGATNIKELLAVAKKHGVKVKNFQFFMPETAIAPQDKKLVQKVTSADIFKMITPKSEKATMPTQSVLNGIIKQEVIKEASPKISSLQTTQTVEVTKTTLATVLHKEIKKEVKLEKVIRAEEDKSTEPEMDAEVFEVKKPQKSEQNRLSTLLKPNIQASQTKETPQPLVSKDETLIKTDSSKEEIKESPKESSYDKPVAMHDIKSESSLKMKESVDVKKTFNTFAMEFKEKLEAYKPPMMKVNMQLSPGNLGDVDVTLLTRGNNLHVNIHSNTSSMAIFMQNQAEFKASLVNLGFSDLQMNFTDKRGEEGHNQQNSKKQEEQSDYHDSLEEEELEGVNMVLPHYV